jgi:hypothetical protein
MFPDAAAGEALPLNKLPTVLLQCLLQDVRALISPSYERADFTRLRTHNQSMTVPARAIAERKTVGDLS